MGNTLLRMEHISKEYPGVKALSDVHLTLDKGEVLALVGENGAGKSTLMKILSGSVKADSGSIYINETEVNFASPKQAIDSGISIMYQELNYLDELSIAENIFLGRLPAKNKYAKVVDYRALNRQTKEVLEKVGLKHSPSTPVSALSIAEKQLVEIAKAISKKISILIMDEPTSALNEEETNNLFRIIRELSSQGISIIYISHRMDEIFRISDRTMVMRDGCYITDVKTSDTNKDELVAYMVGRKIGDMYPKRHVDKGNVLIEVEDLTVKKIRNISLTVREGEVVGLFGLMGSGRTELVESIFGVHKIKSGKIRIHGKEVAIRSPLSAIRQGIAYVPSERKQDGLILSHSVKANVTIASLKKYKRGISLNLSKENERVKQWIDKLDIKSARVNTLVETLSGGNQQKVVLAKWLENEPKILILNEPTRGIDVGAKVEIYRILEMLCKNKIGVLMISSELPEIMAIADRIIVIHDGQLMGECAQEEVNQEKLMNLAIGGEN